MRCSLAIATVAVLLIAIPTKSAQPSVATPIKDCAGEVLPKGALLRLGSKRWRVGGDPRRIEVTPDGKSLAVLTDLRTIDLIDPLTGLPIKTLGISIGLSGNWNMEEKSTAISRDDRWMAFPVYLNNRLGIRIQDLHKQHSDVDLQVCLERGEEPKLPPNESAEKVMSSESYQVPNFLEFSTDGKILAIDDKYHYKCFGKDEEHPLLDLDEHTLLLVAVPSGKEIARAKVKLKAITDLRFSPDGCTLTAACVDGSVHHFDTRTGDERSTWQCAQPANCSAFSPDGKWIAFGGKGEVVLCKTLDGAARRRLTLVDAKSADPKAGPKITAVCFSNDGKRLISAHSETVTIWDLADNAGPIARKLAARPIKKVTFAKDNASFFTIHENEKVIRAWDTTSFRAKNDIVGHTSPVAALGFSSDGERLLTSADMEDVTAWNVRDGKVLPLTGSGTVEEKKMRLIDEWMESSAKTSLLLSENGLVRISP